MLPSEHDKEARHECRRGKIARNAGDERAEAARARSGADAGQASEPADGEVLSGMDAHYILFHGKRHPAEMGEAEINAFLTHLAVEKRVSARLRRKRFARCCTSTERFWAGRWGSWRT